MDFAQPYKNGKLKLRSMSRSDKGFGMMSSCRFVPKGAGDRGPRCGMGTGVPDRDRGRKGESDLIEPGGSKPQVVMAGKMTCMSAIEPENKNYKVCIPSSESSGLGSRFVSNTCQLSAHSNSIHSNHMVFCAMFWMWTSRDKGLVTYRIVVRSRAHQTKMQNENHIQNLMYWPSFFTL